MRAAHYIPVLQQTFDVCGNSYSVVVKAYSKNELVSLNSTSYDDYFVGQ